MMTTTTPRFRSKRIAMTLGAVAALLAAAACNSGILDVKNPQAFSSGNLDSPAILQNVGDGAEGLFHQAFSSWIVRSELLSDELESTSTWLDWEDISFGRVRGDWPSPGDFSFAMDQLLRARFAAQDAIARVKRVNPSTANTLLAQVEWVDGTADLLLGMVYCEGPLAPNAPRSPDTALLAQSVTKLETALASATAAGNAEWVNAAHAALARAYLATGQYDKAVAAAQAVPAGYVKEAVYAEGSGNQQSEVGNQFNQAHNRSGGLRVDKYAARVHEIDPVKTGEAYLRDWFDPTQDDKRMAVTRFTGQLGVNNHTQYYGITKYADRSANIPMFTKREMNLIEAEAAMKKNDFAGEAALLNIDRVAHGLKPITAPTSAAEALNALLNERQAVLWIEGQRTWDLARYNLVATKLGPGRATKLPMSMNEVFNNSSMKVGEASCPKLS